MMEFSSPLAAMHAPSVPTWGGRRDLPSSRLMYSGAQTLAPSSFNFRDMSMQKRQNPSQDYFSMRPPTRGSSPTMSLAADLSSNFHIDQSPQIPTPRRSLFARDLFSPHQNKDLLVTPPVEGGATTPPIPSSSPAMDCMDISPLPHKAPCFVVHLPSPSPEPTPEEEDEQMLTPGRDEDVMVLAPPPTMVLPPQARKPSIARPSLMKSKMHSTTSVPTHTGKEVLLPPFQFGSGVTSLTCSSTPSLPETLTESPIEELTPSATAVRRPSLTNLSRANGSPMGGVTRKSSLIPPRPRKQVRRSHSMFQHPNDVMKVREEYEPPVPTVSSIVDLDTEYKHKLPHFTPDDPDSLPRIQQDTLVNVLEGQYSAHYDKVLVIDARFEYEYEGGHIDGAVNYTNRERLAKELFDRELSSRTLIIFHCEYSQHRAPLMAKFIRNHDRMVNAHRYPHLTYPEVYILDGGYSQFFKQYRTKCFPQAYVEMEHKDHEHACEKGMGKLKQRAKLSRAQTFAFGQSCQLEDSPTSTFGRSPVNRSFSSMDASDISPMMVRSFARRLVSY